MTVGSSATSTNDRSAPSGVVLSTPVFGRRCGPIMIRPRSAEDARSTVSASTRRRCRGLYSTAHASCGRGSTSVGITHPRGDQLLTEQTCAAVSVHGLVRLVVERCDEGCATRKVPDQDGVPVTVADEVSLDFAEQQARA